MIETIITTGAPIIGGSMMWFMVDRFGVKLMTKYFPKLFFPFILRQFQKLDDLIDDSKKNNPKFRKTITAFEDHLIVLCERMVETLRR